VRWVVGRLAVSNSDEDEDMSGDGLRNALSFAAGFAGGYMGGKDKQYERARQKKIDDKAAKAANDKAAINELLGEALAGINGRPVPGVTPSGQVTTPGAVAEKAKAAPGLSQTNAPLTIKVNSGVDGMDKTGFSPTDIHDPGGLASLREHASSFVAPAPDGGAVKELPMSGLNAGDTQDASPGLQGIGQAPANTSQQPPASPGMAPAAPQRNTQIDVLGRLAEKAKRMGRMDLLGAMYASGQLDNLVKAAHNQFVSRGTPLLRRFVTGHDLNALNQLYAMFPDGTSLNATAFNPKTNKITVTDENGKEKQLDADEVVRSAIYTMQGPYQFMSGLSARLEEKNKEIKALEKEERQRKAKIEDQMTVFKNKEKYKETRSHSPQAEIDDFNKALRKFAFTRDTISGETPSAEDRKQAIQGYPMSNAAKRKMLIQNMKDSGASKAQIDSYLKRMGY